MAHVSSRRLKTTRDLLLAGGIFAWALYHTPDALPEKTVGPVLQKAGPSSAAVDVFQAPGSAPVEKTKSTAPVRSGATMSISTSPEPDSSGAASPEIPVRSDGHPHPIVSGVPVGYSADPHIHIVRDSNAPTAIQHRAEVRGHGFTAAVPDQPVKSPVAFAIAEADVKLAPLEEEVIYLAQQSFADEMKSAPVTDPASHEYASHWQRAVEAHDDYLRRMLGWDKFNQLSAVASQRSYAESGVLK